MIEHLVPASKKRRFGAVIIDGTAIFLLWYMLTQKDLGAVNTLLKTLDPNSEGALDQFAQAIFKTLSAFLLKGIFCQTVYYCQRPAIIGRGRTLGKAVFGLAMVDAETGREASPSRLILREFVGRTVVETVLVLPGVVSIVLAFTGKGLMLHDRIARTIVAADMGDIEEDRVGHA